MPVRNAMVAIILAAALALPVAAKAFDESKYPDMQAQWSRPAGSGIQWDPSKPGGRPQQPPLTPEYQAIWEASMADQQNGGQGNDPLYRCYPVGMPRVMNAVFPMEIVISPNTTYMLFEASTPRRIFTDGRDWPAELEPTLLGYSIGQWVDSKGEGRFDTLEVETRGFKGPRAFDSSGIPLHHDNQTVVKERIYLDAADRDVFHDQVTVFDHALTRPWTVIKNYRREPVVQPYWREVSCAENNNHVEIGQEAYMFSADGYLMPTKKDQPGPDLRYFKPR